MRITKKQLLAALIALVLAFGSVVAAPKTYTIKEAGLQFEIPDGWKVGTEDKNGLLQHKVTSADEEVIFFFVVAEDPAMAEKLWDAYRGSINKEMKDVKSEGPKQDKFNGMEHYSESGTGVSQATKMEWSLDVLAASKPVLIFSIIAAESIEKHTAAVSQFLSSLKRVSS